MSNQFERRPVRPFTKAVARHIRDIMKAEGLTQSALAQLVKRDQSYISERVSGKRAFSTDDIDAIAHMLGLEGRMLLIEIARRLESDKTATPLAPHEMSDPVDIHVSSAFAKAANKRKGVEVSRQALTDSD